MPRHEWAKNELREAARRYAAGQHWMVLPGHYHDRYGCSCGNAACDVACGVPGTHPVNAPATLDPSTIRDWWSRDPYSIILPTGDQFDVLDIPAAAGRESLLRLEILGHRLGPVARSGSGRILIWVRPGSRPPGSMRQYGRMGIQYHGAGDFVVAPPSCGARWLTAPSHAAPQLPQVLDLIGTVLCACRQTRTQQVRHHFPAQRMGNQLEERLA